MAYGKALSKEEKKYSRRNIHLLILKKTSCRNLERKRKVSRFINYNFLARNDDMSDRVSNEIEKGLKGSPIGSCMRAGVYFITRDLKEIFGFQI